MNDKPKPLWGQWRPGKCRHRVSPAAAGREPGICLRRDGRRSPRPPPVRCIPGPQRPASGRQARLCFQTRDLFSTSPSFATSPFLTESREPWPELGHDPRHLGPLQPCRAALRTRPSWAQPHEAGVRAAVCSATPTACLPASLVGKARAIDAPCPASDCEFTSSGREMGRGGGT